MFLSPRALIKLPATLPGSIQPSIAAPSHGVRARKYLAPSSSQTKMAARTEASAALVTLPLAPAPPPPAPPIGRRRSRARPRRAHWPPRRPSPPDGARPEPTRNGRKADCGPTNGARPRPSARPQGTVGLRGPHSRTTRPRRPGLEGQQGPRGRRGPGCGGPSPRNVA